MRRPNACYGKNIRPGSVLSPDFPRQSEGRGAGRQSQPKKMWEATHRDRLFGSGVSLLAFVRLSTLMLVSFGIRNTNAGLSLFARKVVETSGS